MATQAITHSFLVPTQLFRLLERLPATGALGSLVTLGYGSSPIPPDRLRELVARFGPIFNQLYGMAEIASIGTMLRKDDHVAGLAGRPAAPRVVRPAVVRRSTPASSTTTGATSSSASAARSIFAAPT